MKVILNVHQVWDTIDPRSTNSTKNNVVTKVLFQLLPEDLMLQAGTMSTRKEIWDAIKTRHLGAGRV